MLELRSLAAEPFVVCPRHIKPDLYTQIVNLCQQAGFQPKIVQEASPPEVMLSFVEAGTGIALVSANAEARHNVGVIYRPRENDWTILDNPHSRALLVGYISCVVKGCPILLRLLVAPG